MAQEVQEVVKSWLGHLDTMLEFDDGISVDSVEELKAKYGAEACKAFRIDMEKIFYED